MPGTTRREQLQAMLQDDPNDAFLRYGLAMEYLSEGNTQEAVRQFQGMIADKLEYVPAYQLLGQTLQRLDRIDEARTAFQQGIALARRVGNTHAADEMAGFLDTLG